MYFIWLPSSELAIQRVAKRVREGGHNIPDAVVRRRYARGLTNLFDLYIPIVTTVCVYDGASFPPIPIAEIGGEKKLVLDYNGCQQRARIDTSMADFLATSCSIHAE
jgi:predicted ABC-type ATPase